MVKKYRPLAPSIMFLRHPQLSYVTIAWNYEQHIFWKQHKPVEYEAFIILFDNLATTSGSNFPFLFSKSLHAVRV